MMICDKWVGMKVFWEMVKEILILMVYEVFCNMFLKDVEVEMLIVKII